MKTLKDQITILKDLKRQHEIASYRYYTAENQAVLLELIKDEIENCPKTKVIPEDMYATLSVPENLATNSVENLCFLYRKVILLCSKSGDNTQ
jgi:hypothetical protein